MSTPHTYLTPRRTRFGRLLFTLAIGLMSQVGPANAESFSEPHTVFYGKVLGTGSAQDFLITDGDVVWTIINSEGEEVHLETTLYEWNDGDFSYRLNIPHSAFALGLNSPPGGIPLPPTPTIHLHAEVTVDGETATLLGPASSVFSTEQLTRSSSYRLDLALGRVATDSDGDGIADWWEDKYGLDKQDGSDAQTDLSGDGLSALDAYIRGLDPTQDNRMPMLLTRELIVYPSGSTAILLDTADLDSTAEQLIYTLTALPPSGALTLRNATLDSTNPDQLLSVGGTFSQADLLNGRLVYDQPDLALDPGSFSVTVGDGETGHTSDEADVQLLAFHVPPALSNDLLPEEAQRIDNALYAASGSVIMDASDLPGDLAIANPSAGLDAATLAAYLSNYGADRPYVFVGASGDALQIQGGQQDDVLVAGEGSGALTGGPGADRFVFRYLQTGSMVVDDFSAADGDVIDLSSLRITAGSFVNPYLRLALQGGTYRLELDGAGTGAAYTNLTIALPGLPVEEADLYALIQSGRVDIGTLDLQPRVTVAATLPQASENGPAAGAFTLYRQGSLIGDLTVNLIWSGVAQNGTDYELKPSTIVMPSGVASLVLPVMPYKDGISESTETVSLTAAAGSSYLVGAANQAALTIEDLLMLVSIEALEPVAVKTPMSPGLFVLSRTDVLDRSVIIYLAISGTSSAGTDYETILPYVQMAANQSDALISVLPKPGAVLDGGVETVRVSIQPRSTYRASDASSARVMVIEQEDSFADWQAREFPASAGEDPDAFAAAASGASPISHLDRYAFGLDPHNPDTAGLPRPMVIDGRLVVTFRKPIGIDDVSYQVVGAQTVDGLDQGPVSMTLVTMPTDDVEPDRVYYQIHENEQDAPTAFSLIEVQWLP